jgi:hypothetical protein
MQPASAAVRGKRHISAVGVAQAHALLDTRLLTSRSLLQAALGAPEEEGARKYRSGKPNLADRFQSGGSGGAGPEAGKPRAR